jgi:hypothetical protein
MKPLAALVTSSFILFSCTAATAQDKAKDASKGKKKTVTKLPGIDIHVTEKRLVIEGFICRQRSSQLEVLACTKKGKTHESLLLIKCSAEHLQLGLILSGIKPTPQVKSFGEVKALDKGQKVVIEVQWTDKKRMILCKSCFDGKCKLHKDPLQCKTCVKILQQEKGGWCENCLQGWRWERRVTCKKCWLRTCQGHFQRECIDCKLFKEGKRKAHCVAAVDHGDLECPRCYVTELEGIGWCKLCKRGFKGGLAVRYRVEDLIVNRHKEAAMKRVGFVFTGSRHIEVPAPPDFDKKKRVFAAKHTGNVGVLFHDPDAILDTPLIEGGDDTSFLPNAGLLPRRFTPVRIFIRPWAKGDDKGSPGGAESKKNKAAKRVKESKKSDKKKER